MTQDQTPVVDVPAGKVAAVQGFVTEARIEMEKVSWPGKDELVKATRAVLIGAVVLGLVIGLVESFAGFYLPDGIKDVAAYVVVLIMLMVRPNGLFGEKLRKKV